MSFQTFYNDHLRVAIAQITEDGKYLIEVQDLSMTTAIRQLLTPDELRSIYIIVKDSLSIQSDTNNAHMEVLSDELEWCSNLPVLLQKAAELTALQQEYELLLTKHEKLRKRASNKWTALYDIQIEKANRDTALLREMNEKLLENLEIESVQSDIVLGLVRFLRFYEGETSDPFYARYAREAIKKVEQQLLQHGGRRNERLAKAIIEQE